MNFHSQPYLLVKGDEILLVGLCNQKFVLASAKLKKCSCYCPACGEKLVLRSGSIKICHFAHIKGSDCCSSEGETTEHLQGKKQLLDWAVKNHIHAELEVYLPEIHQRPDVLLTRNNGQRIALEFQCSPLSVKRLRERNEGYQSMNIKVWWILGSPYIKRKLTRQKIAQFLQIRNNKPVLLFWSTKQQKLISKIYEIEPLQHPSKEYKYSLTKQIQLIQKKIRMKDVSIVDLQKFCYLNHRNLAGVPFAAHNLRLVFDLLIPNELHWRVDILMKLNLMPINYAWNKNRWMEQLIDYGNWLDFPCICTAIISRWRFEFVSAFMEDLAKYGIIKISDTRVMYINKAKWFENSDQKINLVKQK